MRPGYLLIAAMLATRAAAQDFSPLASISSGMLGSIPNTAAMNDVILHNQGVPGYKAPSPHRTPGAPTPTASLRYRVTPEAARCALDAYVARARRSDPRSADAAYAELSRHDLGAIYRTIAGPFGLREDDAADSFTALAVLGWMITTGAPDPAPRSVQAARDQFATALAADPAIARNPTAAGEEYKLSFLILYSGWKAARHDGGLVPFRDGVARLFAQRGLDLRGLQLSPDGFRSRRD